MSEVVKPAAVRASLLARREIALLDVREEGVYADAHPLFAASLPLSRLELEVLDRVPRSNVQVVVYDRGEGLAERAAAKLAHRGYSRVAVLEGGLDGWVAAGYEVFRDVNSASKAFGELVESQRHTPSMSATELDARLRANEDLVVLDARRFEEYQAMSIPAGTSVPGAELVLRARDLAPSAATLVVVNCAGRTRSIIGAQSLINAAIPNPVAALRNGTIGWSLAGLPLEHAQSRRYGTVKPATRGWAAQSAEALAARAGVGRTAARTVQQWLEDPDRTLYRFDVRSPEEYVVGHRAGFRSAPGGQLVQETDVFAPVRGARIVLADDDGVRAFMTATWLAQMGWEVTVLASDASDDGGETGPERSRTPPLPDVSVISAAELASLPKSAARIIDLSPSAAYARGHVPGAEFAIRAQLEQALAAGAQSSPAILVSTDGVLAAYAAPEVEALSGRRPRVLAGGTAAWQAGGFELEIGLTRLLTPPVDRYKRPYEGSDNPRESMQAYLEWEYGLVAQLARDGTHHFHVI